MYTRELETILKKWLDAKEIIILYGARQVGKTTLITQMLSKMNDAVILNCERPEVNDILVSKNPAEIRMLFGDKKIVALDEAQKVTNIGSVLKLIYDDNSFHQKIIATGSGSFELANRVSEPLTGRNVKFRLHPLSVPEIVNYNDWLWFRENLEQLLIYGMYPGILGLPLAQKTRKLLDLSSDYLFRDILAYENIKNPSLLRKLLKALALQIGAQVSYHELSLLLGVASLTVEKYIDLLEKSFVIFSISSFSRNLRNEIRKSKKFYFYDLGIRNAIISSFQRLDNRADVGSLWENFCMAERMKYNEIHHPGTNLYFWRTYDGAEIDLVEERDGSLSAFEFKWQSKKSARFPKYFMDTYNPVHTVQIHRENVADLFPDPITPEGMAC
jgi:predicted AAA+ superfamily ATPase